MDLPIEDSNLQVLFHLSNTLSNALHPSNIMEVAICWHPCHLAYYHKFCLLLLITQKNPITYTLYLKYSDVNTCYWMSSSLHNDLYIMMLCLTHDSIVAIHFRQDVHRTENPNLPYASSQVSCPLYMLTAAFLSPASTKKWSAWRMTTTKCSQS